MNTSLENLFSCFDDDYFGEISQFSKRNGKAAETYSNRQIKRKAQDDIGPPSDKTKKCDPLLDISIDITKLDPEIDVLTIAKDEGCLHEVAVPSKKKFCQLVDSNTPPAKTYKFPLDPFQKKAIQCVENNQSVLVSAHTSAGKTVIAEYAIALALKNKQRVIYTTPIKALSNQKYRELLEEFKDVGIMTGDVTINPMASCIVMTTEILRSMLFRGSEVTKEVGWVIFDEIHYMRDKVRGVVWEETIILLPDNVRYVFLSATIPNARQFAEWVSHLHHQPCHVVYTEYRPTPLHHYLFPNNADGMHLVIDEKCQLIQRNFDAAMRSVGVENSEEEDSNNSPSQPAILKKSVFKVVKEMMDRKLAPLIIFSFKKNNCETFATYLSSLNFNTETEQKLVDEVFNNAIDILSDEEKQLPQITKMLPLLRKGIAFHHSGVLPLIKEIVEILFGEGLIKALFATETFAMGLNMPAKTVIFTSISKFDGLNIRKVTSGEYIQMSGRAGRRGLDVNGLIVLMIDEQISASLLTQILMGKADPLNSAFHLTYNMILNLMRQEEINPEYMIEKSFLIFQTKAKLLELIKNVKMKQKKYARIHIPNEEAVSSYCSLVKQLESIHEEIKYHTYNSRLILPFLHKGRLVKIKTEDCEYDWGIILDYQNHPKKKSTNGDLGIQIRAMIHVQTDSKKKDSLPAPASKKKTGRVGIYTFDYKEIHQISSIRLNLYGKNKKIQSKNLLKDIKKLKKQFPRELPLLHPINDVGIDKPNVIDLLEKVTYFENMLTKNPVYGPKNKHILSYYEKKLNLEKEIFDIKDEIDKNMSVLKMDELQCRKNVLRKLGYCNEMDVINMKGRVACELNCVDELLMTEMLFNGIFNDLSIEYCVGLLSCFICKESGEFEGEILDPLINNPLRLVEDIATMIGNTSVECKLIKNKEEYLNNCFQKHLVEIVMAWCKGVSFLEICRKTFIYEGSIIRYLRMMEEVLRELCKAATNVGNIDLENRFSEGIRLLKRGVVFAGSLYL